jgi:hypothetical protein
LFGWDVKCGTSKLFQLSSKAPDRVKTPKNRLIEKAPRAKPHFNILRNATAKELDALKILRHNGIKFW